MQRMRESKKMSLRMAVCETFAFKCFLLKKFRYFSLRVRERGEERLRLSDFIISPAGEGRSYAEGAQRDSGAIPLRVPASGGVWLSNKLLSPHTVSD